MGSDMTPDEYKQVFEQLNLNPASAAAAIGYSDRVSYRYSRGEGAIPRPVAKLMRLAAATKLTPEQLEAL
jgi:hypothetical protein